LATLLLSATSLAHSLLLTVILLIPNNYHSVDAKGHRTAGQLGWILFDLPSHLLLQESILETLLTADRVNALSI
jgi:hypothetical protein